MARRGIPPVRNWLVNIKLVDGTFIRRFVRAPSKTLAKLNFTTDHRTTAMLASRLGVESITYTVSAKGE